MKPIRSIQADAIQAAIDQMAGAIACRHANTEKLALVSIADGGPPVGAVLLKAVQDRIRRSIPIGTLDISFHRDDLERRLIPKVSHPTNIEFDIDGISIILTDDVLFTGRSARAAINELFDHGRPECVELAVLFDRKGRRLPIEANYKGFEELIPINHRVVVVMNPDLPEEHRIDIFES